MSRSLRIVERAVYLGPSIYAHEPVIRLTWTRAICATGPAAGWGRTSPRRCWPPCPAWPRTATSPSTYARAMACR